MGRISPGDSYASAVLPAVLVMGCGLVFTVAPLTAAVLAAIDVHRAGVGSAINNAVARIAALLAVAVLPAAAGVTTLADDLAPQFATAMRITAVLAAVGALVACLTIRRVVPGGVRRPLDGPGAVRPPVRPYARAGSADRLRRRVTRSRSAHSTLGVDSADMNGGRRSEQAQIVGAEPAELVVVDLDHGEPA